MSSYGERSFDILQENIYYPWKGLQIYSLNFHYIHKCSCFIDFINELGKRDKM